MDRPDPGHMNGFFRPYSTDDLRRLAQMNGQNAMMGMMGPAAISGGDLIEGHTLDDIISQNNKEEQRRRSMHQQQQQQHYNPSRPSTHGDVRRSSMLEFGSPLRSDLDIFQFDPSSVSMNNSLSPGTGIAQRRAESQDARRRQSQESLGLNTRFSDIGHGFENITQSPVYQHNLNASDPMAMAPDGYMSQDMPMDMDYVEGLDVQNADMSPMNFFSQDNYDQDLVASPILQNMPESMRGPGQDPGGGGNGTVRNGDEGMIKKLPGVNGGEDVRLRRVPLSAEASTPENGALLRTQESLSPAQGLTTDSLSNTLLNDEESKQYRHTFTTAEPLPGQPAPPTSVPQYKNAYSSSGFDMLGVLMRVATRPSAQISIGAVDMACAFVVCDVTQHDSPIVYCSDMFERLTGYSKHEILGRNCRFLQSPDGKVQSGVKRKYVDDAAIFHLKSMIETLSEAQISVINYRKGGQPFMNLLTMIPITYDSDEIKYYVGFQVDLVENPTSITNKNPDGSYGINYQRDLLPRYVFNPPDTSQRDSELGQTIGRDEVSTVLSTIGSGESELSKRIWDKVLLENTDDVVHVLSLKGLFLYLSPSSRKVLEYEPHELVGMALSSVCHPSDIVPVTRELKDTSTGVAVSVVFRIRRKHSGYTWFESHGALHTEQGKGKKCIILVGRQRPVYALARNDINASGGIGEGEIWMKMSTSGMFLFVSSNVRLLLDRPPDELVGTTAHLLLRSESKTEFGRMLEKARTGVRATLKHDINHKRGHTLQAQTTIYPGDADEGQKPTFLVVQMRILKVARNTVPAPPKPSSKSGSETPSTNRSGGSRNSQRSPPQASANPSKVVEVGVVTQPGGSGLAIGSQHEALASEDNVFDELKTTRSTSWQFELRQMEKRNRLLAEELQSLLSNRKKRKRRKGPGSLQKDCANCHTRSTPEWRRGPSGNRDLCNSCGLRWAKQNGRISSRNSSGPSDQRSASPTQSSPVLPFSTVPPSTVPGAPYPPANQQPTPDRSASTIDPSSISIPKAPTAHPFPAAQQQQQQHQKPPQAPQPRTSPQRPQPPSPLQLPPQLPPPTRPPLYPAPASLNPAAAAAAATTNPNRLAGANVPPNGAGYRPAQYAGPIGQIPLYPGAEFAEAKPPHVTQASRGIGFGGPGQGGGSLNLGRPAKIEEGVEY